MLVLSEKSASGTGRFKTGEWGQATSANAQNFEEACQSVTHSAGQANAPTEQGPFHTTNISSELESSSKNSASLQMAGVIQGVVQSSTSAAAAATGIHPIHEEKLEEDGDDEASEQNTPVQASKRRGRQNARNSNN